MFLDDQDGLTAEQRSNEKDKKAGKGEMLISLRGLTLVDSLVSSH